MAWAPWGWNASFLSEIEPFPRAVLKHHYPEVPLHGDFTTIQPGRYPAIDLLVGGTPCQSFSIAGLRGGLCDDRGVLALEFLRLVDRLGPRWVVWENVRGVLSSGSGRDFGSILGGLAELGYGFAWRVLDTQYVRTRRFGRAIPQRRRRVFLVGHTGGAWQRSAAVLFDAESLRGNSAPRRKPGAGFTHDVAACLTGSGRGTERTGETRGQDPVIAMAHGQANAEIARDRAPSLTCNHEAPIVVHGLRGISDYGGEVPTLRAKGGDAGGGSEALMSVPVAFDCKGSQVQFDQTGSAPTLRSMSHSGSHANAGGHAAVAYDLRGREGGSQFEGRQDTANIRAASGGSSRSYVATRWAVRRLMPVECERLMGFRDGYTAIPWRGKDPENCPDGPRYKALGNSISVNDLDWLAGRIEMVDRLERVETMRGAMAMLGLDGVIGEARV